MPTEILFWIGRADGGMLSAEISGLGRAVQRRGFATAFEAVRFQEEVLGKVDPEGLLAGHYCLYPATAEDVVTEAKRYSKRVCTGHHDLAFNGGWVVESRRNNADENEHEEMIAYLDTETLADCLLRGLTNQVGPFGQEKWYDIVSPAPPKILVTVEGGCVTSVMSTVEAIEATLVDYDNHDQEYQLPDLDLYPYEIPLN